MPAPLIRTKLHRPPPPKDQLRRRHLLERLDRRRSRPLTLVSAPAGYGKSTLVSCWLDTCVCPGAWVSLDENDNDLQSFLAYFLAAVESVFPGAVRETRSLLETAGPPYAPPLAGSLINELDEIDKPFILY
ncbi:MAG: hypothetical protein GY859_00980 [Desulfobacterales bacterium]|nr:hypothetical protein [Desulfobacterales bacterium]